MQGLRGAETGEVTRNLSTVVSDSLYVIRVLRLEESVLRDKPLPVNTYFVVQSITWGVVAEWRLVVDRKHVNIAGQVSNVRLRRYSRD